MIISNGGTIFDGITYYSKGITSASTILLSCTTAKLINSGISPGISYNSFFLSPYYNWNWGGFRNAGKDFWHFFYTSKGIDGFNWQGFRIGTFSIPIILGNFSYVSESLRENEVFYFDFSSEEHLNTFRLLFGVNAVQTRESIIIKKSDINANANTTAESLFARIFIRNNSLLNQNPSFSYQGKTLERNIISHNYWMQLIEPLKLDDDGNVDPFSARDLGDL